MDVREKLVEIVERASVRTLPKNTCHTNIVMLVNALIEEGVTVQEWISVKDRLPEKNGCYIVTACDEGCSCDEGIWYDTVVIEAEHYKGEWSWNENGTEYDITCFVTHWQPMPQPPKGE